jgi:hypothetical protein
MSYKVVKESESLLEACPTAAALEGFLCTIDSLLLPDTGVGWEGCPMLGGTAQLSFIGGGLVLEAYGGYVILLRFSTHTGLL